MPQPIRKDTGAPPAGYNNAIRPQAGAASAPLRETSLFRTNILNGRQLWRPYGGMLRKGSLPEGAVSEAD